MIPLEAPVIVGASPCSDTVGSAGGFLGRAGSTTGVAQTVRPQPGDETADNQSARLSHSPHRDVRGKRNPARRPSAGCLLCNPRVASAARTARSVAAASGGERRYGWPSALGQRRRGERRAEFFGPDVAGDAPVHLTGPMRKRKPEVLFTSRSHVGSRPKKLGASCSPRRSVGQRVCLPSPSQGIRDKGVILDFPVGFSD